MLQSKNSGMEAYFIGGIPKMEAYFIAIIKVTLNDQLDSDLSHFLRNGIT